ncbi:hypothetical protein G9P44_003912 [Scheffersomyces stipitis]|nr:hypothetical protein G9P44_003912 [Scheffersomyces stipitis]
MSAEYNDAIEPTVEDSSEPQVEEQIENEEINEDEEAEDVVNDNEDEDAKKEEEQEVNADEGDNDIPEQSEDIENSEDIEASISEEAGSEEQQPDQDIPTEPEAETAPETTDPEQNVESEEPLLDESEQPDDVAEDEPAAEEVDEVEPQVEATEESTSDSVPEQLSEAPTVEADFETGFPTDEPTAEPTDAPTVDTEEPADELPAEEDEEEEGSAEEVEEQENADVENEAAGDVDMEDIPSNDVSVPQTNDEEFDGDIPTNDIAANDDFANFEDSLINDSNTNDVESTSNQDNFLLGDSDNKYNDETGSDLQFENEAASVNPENDELDALIQPIQEDNEQVPNNIDDDFDMDAFAAEAGAEAEADESDKPSGSNEFTGLNEDVFEEPDVIPEQVEETVKTEELSDAPKESADVIMEEAESKDEEQSHDAVAVAVGDNESEDKKADIKVATPSVLSVIATAETSTDSTPATAPQSKSTVSEKPQYADDDEEEEDDDDEDEKDTRVYTKQTHLIVVPSYACWFNMKKIHQIEKESLPEFFGSSHPSKSPKIYVNYRNFMINSYRLNPNEFLTLTSCRRNLVGDVGTLMRVHRFLSKWGLINYQVKPQFKPGYAVEKLPNGQSVGLPYTGDYHVKYDTPRGLFPFDTFKMNPEKVNVDKLKKLLKIEDNASVTTGSVTDGNAVSNSSYRSEESKKRSSPSADEQPSKKQNDGWSAEETEKLITAVKTYRNDWFKVAEAVGTTKTPQQCILKFLKYPIEDRFNPISEKELGLARFGSNYPISGVDNPVLSNLAFLSSFVDSDVAKAASQRASKVMDEKIEEKIKEIAESKKAAEAKNAAEEKSEDSKDKEEAAVKPESETSAKISSEQNGKADHLELVKDVSEGEANTLKDAAAASFGIVGARSHLFATFEEREMNSISSNIVNHQLAKIDLKLQKVDELERVYECQKRRLAKQQEEIFIDRLALAKSTINITKKLDDVISLLENQVKAENSSPEKLSSINNLLAEAKNQLYKPARHSLIEATGESTTNGDDPEHAKDAESSNATAANVNEDDLKPLSLKTPQTFKVWVP